MQTTIKYSNAPSFILVTLTLAIAITTWWFQKDAQKQIGSFLHFLGVNTS